MSVFVLVLILLTVNNYNTLNAQSFLKKLAKSLSSIGTEKTSSLKDASVTARYWGNCYSPALKIATGEELYLSDIWEEGANIVSITFYKAKGVGSYEIDGTVKVNGQDMPYMGNGLYAIKVKDNQPKTINVQTSTGEKMEITVKPVAAVEILEPKNSEVDTKKDMTVKLKNPAGSENTQIMVALYSKPTLTQYSWHTINYFRSANEIHIPAFAFASGHDNKFDYVKGDSHILVERFTVNPEKTEGVCEVRNISCYYATAPIKANIQKAEWFPAKDTRKEDGYDITENENGIQIGRMPGSEKDEPYLPGVNVMKLNMMDGIPFVKARKMAVISFTTRATQLTKTTETYQTVHKTEVSGDWITDTWTTYKNCFKIQFPELPVEYWQNINDAMYKDLEKQMKEKMNIELVPIETVLNAKSYQDLKEVQDSLTDEIYIGTYKGLKKIYKNNLVSIFGGYTGPQKRLMQELGVDGVITIDLNLTMSLDGADAPKHSREYNFTLDPSLTYNIFGPPNGTEYAPTTYSYGFSSGKGLSLLTLGEKVGKGKKDGQLYSFKPDVLVKASRAHEIIKALTDSWMKMKKEEEKLGYNKLWESK